MIYYYWHLGQLMEAAYSPAVLSSGADHPFQNAINNLAMMVMPSSTHVSIPKAILQYYKTPATSHELLPRLPRYPPHHPNPQTQGLPPVFRRSSRIRQRLYHQRHRKLPLRPWVLHASQERIDPQQKRGPQLGQPRKESGRGR